MQSDSSLRNPNEKSNKELPDEVLVVAAILGDFEAFNELVLRYRTAVVRFAQSIVGFTDAEDVAQDTLLLAFKALPSIENPDKFAAWLMTIARNRALRFIKRKKDKSAKHVEFDEMLLEHISELNQPLIDRKDSNEEIMMALAKLPEEYAMVMRMRYFDEMPLKRMTAFLNVPMHTIKWRIFRGKQLLRDQINLLREGEKKWIEKKN
ncbi:sigma-70 family RNA polymerase sigma factor [candidate division KSB1 bacterium]|nr:sigma-70 family RNA polymerase sigma factor [candidate division KSB1 bacterium]